MIVDDFNIYKLTNIIRFSQLPKIKNESVAEHSYFVMWFVNRICTINKLSDKIRLTALQSALLHDIPEIITNDITYDVKKMIPQISSIIEPYEKQVISEHSIDVVNTLFYPDSYEERVAKKVVKHADILSVMLYCMNEAHLGNKAFDELVKETELRLEKSREELFEEISKGGHSDADEQ